MIEVNDDPNLDAGVKEQVLGDELYDRLIAEFVQRLERRRGRARVILGFSERGPLQDPSYRGTLEIKPPHPGEGHHPVTPVNTGVQNDLAGSAHSLGFRLSPE